MTALVELINQEQHDHIVLVEDPIVDPEEALGELKEGRRRRRLPPLMPIDQHRDAAEDSQIERAEAHPRKEPIGQPLQALSDARHGRRP